MAAPKTMKYLVISEGYKAGFDPDLEDTFDTYEKALEYAECEAGCYPGLEYYICPIMWKVVSSVQLHRKRYVLDR